MQNNSEIINLTEPLSIPYNVACPCRCAFCYESKFTRLFPWIKTDYIPRYTDETFKYYQKVYSQQGRVTNEEFCVRRVGAELRYFPHCDFFALGLTARQIETLVLSHKNSGKELLIHTTGYNADPKFVNYLSSKYPRTFRVHLSIVTFDSVIRKNIMSPKIDTEKLKKISDVLIKPVYFLIYFNKEQTISDIELLNQSSIKTQGRLYLHRLYFNKLSPKYIIDYSNKAEKEFKDLIYYLKFNDARLKEVSRRLNFSPVSKIYAWRWKNEIKKLLGICKGTDREAIFCSHGAYEAIRSLMASKTHVIPVKSCFGGCVDFTLGLTVKAVISEIKKLLAGGIRLSRIYLPHPMFCIEGKYDLNCEGIDLIKKAYPKIEIIVIKIPEHILKSTVNLDTCVNYYSSRLKCSCAA